MSRRCRAVSPCLVHHSPVADGLSLHRDVKLENALLDATHTLLKITDFGYAKTSVDSSCMSLVGTPGYAGKPWLQRPWPA